MAGIIFVGVSLEVLNMSKAPLWALVVNSERARIMFDPLGQGAVGTREELIRSPNDNLLDTLSKMSAPGATSNSLAKEAREYRLHREAEDMASFAKVIARTLSFHFAKGDFGSLAIFASRQMLQQINLCFDPGLRSTIVLEHVANIAHVSETGLRKMVRQFLRKSG